MQAPVVLSKRNLLALLHKLMMEGSSRTIIKPGGVVVMSEDDETHYAGRRPGVMHPETECFVELMDKAMKRVQQQMMSDMEKPAWIKEAANRTVGAFGLENRGQNQVSAEEIIAQIISDAYEVG